MLRRGLVITVFATLFGCRPAEPATSPAPPLLAIVDPDLQTTLDPGEPVILEDDARRHSPPPEALRRRVYGLDRRVFRWFPPGPRPHTSSYPADRVVLHGSPAPNPGDRFVAFGMAGRLAVLEATGETCPPGIDNCIACAPEDPGRGHWARVLDGSPSDVEWAAALGPFSADEPLPSPRILDRGEFRRGRWFLSNAMDLDGDGTMDGLYAEHRCSPPRGDCSVSEIWRSHDGRWYAEPAPRALDPPPMRLLELLSWDGRELEPFSPLESIRDPGRVVAIPSIMDNKRPVPGDYWILAASQVVGRIRFSDSFRSDWCLTHGPGCYEAELIEIRPFKGNSQILIAGPIRGDLAVRELSLPRRPRYEERWDPHRPAREFTLALSDGTRRVVNSRPCIEETPEDYHFGTCFETRIEVPGKPTHRHLTGSFEYILGIPASVDVCRAL